MTKSELIQLIDRKQSQISPQDLELAVNQILEIISQALVDGQRIEIRGFGVFSMRQHSARMARNPKTGDAVPLHSKRTIHFKPGKELRENIIDVTTPIAK
jgi:integration host factor subunit beta